MKYYTQFLEKDIKWTGSEWVDTGKQRTAIASDSVYMLDGRKSILNLIEDSNKRLEQLRKVQPNYTGYRIIKVHSRLFENEHILYTTEKK